MSKETKTCWRDVPVCPSAEEIKAEYEADVVVAGLGYSGIAVARAAAEAGLKVVAIEKMPRDRYASLGAQVGHINSRFLLDRGIAPVDPLDLFNEMMLRGGNRANPRLVMRYCRNCGEAFDWFTQPFTEEQVAQLSILFDPPGKQFTGELGGQHFWVGTVMFPFMGMGGDFELTQACLANIDAAQAAGAEIRFGTEAVQLEKTDGRVTALFARGEEGLIRIAAKKAVVLATGDFSANSIPMP